jgi:hypothetical protein
VLLEPLDAEELGEDLVLGLGGDAERAGPATI